MPHISKMSADPPKAEQKWHLPSEVMKLHNLKKRKKALNARITGSSLNTSCGSHNRKNCGLEDRFLSQKRKNPFIKNNDSNKKSKSSLSPSADESTDRTLFKLLHESTNNSNTSGLIPSSFENILNQKEKKEEVFIVKAQGKPNIPVDWSLKTKIRLFSHQPFSWSSKLKISEEASGTTGFVRCLGTSTTTNLDISPNAKFHQCCFYWQQPCLPWLTLFPRTTGKISDGASPIATNVDIKKGLQMAWKDSLRSLFQLIRTKQCPYFYVCLNNFTVLFRAAGISGFKDIHVLIGPTTRGFRQLLRQEEIEFTMPLKKQRLSDQGFETQDSARSDSGQGSLIDDDETPDEQWMQSMGINAEDIKQINYTQAKIVMKSECKVDNSEESLVLVEGVEVHAFYNFLINCKSATAITGPLAGIPPTLLSPVAFNGATLQSLKVRESKVHSDNTNFYSLELTGPILPSTTHNIFGINPSDQSISCTFASLPSTLAFNNVQTSTSDAGNIIFDKENLSDAGLVKKVLQEFCKGGDCVTSIECLKYNADSKTYTWT